jgi:NitT/TauT family transport system ATP-binding protein
VKSTYDGGVARAGADEIGSRQSAPMIELQSLTLRFEKRTQRGKRTSELELVTVLDRMNLTVKRGEFVALLGPSGCGKSTALNTIAGLATPTSGTVLYDGDPVDGINTKVGYVTQHDSLLPWRTVQFNVELPLKIRNCEKSSRERIVNELMRTMGLEGFEAAFPSALSGGMRSRVMLARTLSYEPEALLMDEPFAALDVLTRRKMQDELISLWARTSATVLYVTHDIDEALALADRIVVFSNRPATTIGEYRLDQPRPRPVRSDPAYDALYDEIWEKLRPQV